MAFDPSHTAQKLRKAMKGFGTDDGVLVEAFTSLSLGQLQGVRHAYKKEINRDLVADVKSETSGDYKEAATAALLTIAEHDARQLNKAMKGAGTDEVAMIQILVHTSREHVEDIKRAYLDMYGKTLEHDIKGDTSGDTRKFFLALINSKRDQGNYQLVERDITELYNAGAARWGTDESTFINLITAHDNVYVQYLNACYGRKYGDTLHTAVKKEMSGWLAEGLKAMLTPPDEYFADILFKAMDGAGTDDKVLLRILPSRRATLKAINERFMITYGKCLYHRVKDEVSGKYAKILLSIIKGC